MKVSVILPTFNEAGNITPLVTAIQKNIPSIWDHEIIVMDDQSNDGTYEVVKQAFAENLKVSVFKRTTARGLAVSIHDGIKVSNGDFIIVMDTDFTHSPEEIPNLLHVAQRYDIVSGSRFCAGGNMDSTKHYIASLLYNLIIRLMLKTQIQDNLGGYFIIGREKLASLPLEKIFVGYGDYFFRLLFFAQKSNYSIIEIPAIYRKRISGQSKSNFFKMLLRYTQAALAIRMGES